MNAEEEASQVLKRLYRHTGEYYLLVAESGGLVYEDPRDHQGSNCTEVVLRLFADAQDAIQYLTVGRTNASCQVKKVSLVGLWSLLPQLHEKVLAKFSAPLRVDLSIMVGKTVLTMDILHSTLALMS